MDIVLKIVCGISLGVALTGFLVLLLMPFYISRLGKRAKKTVSSRQIIPTRIKLKPANKLVWTDAKKVSLYREQLLSLSFVSEGEFELDLLQTIKIEGFVNRSERRWAAISERASAGVTVDITGWFTDGTDVTFSSNKEQPVDRRPEKTVVYLPEADVIKLHEGFRARCGAKEAKPLDQRGFAAVVEDAYAQDMDWRMARGFSETEIRRIAEARGKKITPAHVSRVSRSLRDRLQRPIAAAQVQTPETNRGEWSGNFDAENVKPFLRRVAKLIESGFGESEIEKATAFINSTKHDDERATRFQINYRGQSAGMRVRVFMDDIDSPDIYISGPDELCKEIRSEMEAFANELGL